MSLPRCPNCQSMAITWRGDNVPSGHNNCLSCGYLAPVREFHRHAEQLPDYVALKRARQAAADPPPLSDLEIDRIRFAPKPERRKRSMPEPTGELPKVKQWWQD